MIHGAFILARYSTENQSEASIEVQVERCREWCGKQSLPVLDVFADRAISGMKETRPEYQRMMQALYAGGADTVVIYDQSRMFRNMVYWFQFRETLQRIGVHVVSVTQPTVGGDLNDPAVFLNEGVTALFNQMWVLQTQQKVREGVRQRAKSGKHTGGIPALGYRVENERLVIDETEAETVRLIFGLYAAGQSYTEIIGELNRRSLKTKRGRPFGKNSLHDLLKNEKYVGRVLFGGKPVSYDGTRNSHAARGEYLESACPPIVSQELFDAVQQRLLKNRRSPGRSVVNMDQPLKGKVFCGDCGSAMTICYIIAQKTHSRYAYYKCAAKKRGLSCPSKMIRKDELEDIVASSVLDMLGHPNARATLLDVLRTQRNEFAKVSAPRLDALKKEHSVLQTKIRNSVEAIMNGLSSPELIAQTNAAEARKADVEAELKTLQDAIEHQGIPDADLPRLLDKLIKNAKSNSAALLSTVLRVEVYPETIKIWTIFDDNPPDRNDKINKKTVPDILPIDVNMDQKFMHKCGDALWRTNIYAKHEIVIAILAARPQKIR
nr:MAG TPA: integrase [Caudoviricetes sp.]